MLTLGLWAYFFLLCVNHADPSGNSCGSLPAIKSFSVDVNEAFAELSSMLVLTQRHFGHVNVPTVGGCHRVDMLLISRIRVKSVEQDRVRPKHIHAIMVVLVDNEETF